MDGWVGGWMDGWRDEQESRVRSSQEMTVLLPSGTLDSWEPPYPPT